MHWRESLTRLGKVFQIPDLRNRILFVGGMLLLFVLGLHIPAPFVNPEGAKKLFQMGIWGFIDMMSGGAFKRISILALGIVPYINASIIMQLLGIAVPSIQRMQKEGETGRKTLSTYTRWGTVALAILQAAGMGLFLYKQPGVLMDLGLGSWNWLVVVPLVLVMAAGTSFLMWMGEQLTDKGIGNGVSLIIFAGIMIRLPATLIQMVNTAMAQQDNVLFVILRLGFILLIFVAIIVFVTYVTMATRKIPIQHAKRVVGNRIFGSNNTYLPLKVVTAGVIPIIFAISVVMLPSTIAQMLVNSNGALQQSPWIMFLRGLSPGYSWYGGVVYFLLVVFFTYFYTAVVYNVADIADNLKKHGSFIPGLRPGKETERYIDRVLTRLTFAGAIFLGLIAILPYIIPVVMGGASRQSDAALLAPMMGGTSLLIVVSVALETMKQMEAHLVMRHYEGFIK